MKVLNIKEISIIFLELLFLYSTLFFEYYLTLIVAIYFTFKYGVLKQTVKIFQNYIIYIFVIIFYSKYFYQKQSNNQSIFWDMQIFLNKLKCNDEIDFVYKTEYSKNLLNCESINFGPLSEILVFKSNIWVTTLVVAFFFFFMVLIYWFKYIENQKIYYFLFVYFLSPPSLMLFESLNPDIIYLIFFWTLYQKKTSNYGIVWVLVITLLTQLKIYTVGILAGIILLNILNLNIRKAVYNFIFLLINILILFNHFILQERDYPTPFNNTFQTFGIINDFQLANNRFGLNYFYLLIVLVFILSILINLYQKEFHNMSKNFNNRENFLIIFYPVVFIILSFTNFAYKYTVLIFFLILFYENFSKFNKVLLLIMNALISLEYFFGFEIYETTFTIFFIFISKVLFYYFYTFFLITFLLLIKNKIIMKNSIKKFNFQ